MPLAAKASRSAAFSIVELMAATAVVSILMLLLISMTDATTRTWKQTTGKIEQFQGARDAFEAITRKISQATLNTYIDYNSPTNPTRYERRTELRFISGPGLVTTGTPSTHAAFFQAPSGYVDNSTTYSGLPTLLNTWGYYILYSDDSANRPPFITTAIAPTKTRFRLMEMCESSQNLTLYSKTSGNPTYNDKDWFTTPLTSGSYSRPIADNIIALILLPMLSTADQSTLTSLAPSYTYDSTGQGMSTVSDKNLNPIAQLPPVVRVTMVAIDESAARLIDQKNLIGTLQGKLGAFVNASNFDTNLKSLTDFLDTNRLQYRVFTSNVPIKAAKWSREQKN